MSFHILVCNDKYLLYHFYTSFSICPSSIHTLITSFTTHHGPLTTFFELHSIWLNGAISWITLICITKYNSIKLFPFNFYTDIIFLGLTWVKNSQSLTGFRITGSSSISLHLYLHCSLVLNMGIKSYFKLTFVISVRCSSTIPFNHFMQPSILSS